MEATTKFGPDLSIMYADVGASIYTDVAFDGSDISDSWGFGNRSGFCVLFDELRISGHLRAPFKVREIKKLVQQLPSCMHSPAREKKQNSHVSFAAADVLVPPAAAVDPSGSSAGCDQRSEIGSSAEEGNADENTDRDGVRREFDLMGPTKLKLSLDIDGSSSTMADLVKQMDDIMGISEVPN
jgi:hypothetical protein